MQIILFLVFGLVVGALARVIVPGKEPGGWIVSMVLGAILLVAGYHFVARRALA